MACCLSIGTIVGYRGSNFKSPSASLSLSTGSTTRISVSVNVKKPNALCTAFAPSSLSLSSASSFSGSSLGMDLISSFGMRGTTSNNNKRGGGLVVKAAKYTLCQTKRNRSRKSLARTHGFRKRMSTTSGRAVIKRRRAKGRWTLCTKTNPNSGKRQSV